MNLLLGVEHPPFSIEKLEDKRALKKSVLQKLSCVSWGGGDFGFCLFEVCVCVLLFYVVLFINIDDSVHWKLK